MGAVLLVCAALSLVLLPVSLSSPDAAGICERYTDAAGKRHGGHVPRHTTACHATRAMTTGWGQSLRPKACGSRPATVVAGLRLRGGGGLSEFDQQLQDEILNDIKRDEQGKVPVFVEQLGEEEQTGAFKYGAGVEAAMPSVIGEAEDAAMNDEGQEAGRGYGATETEGKTREQCEAEELAEAMKWFAEVDQKYYHHSEFADDPILGHTGIPQRRELMPGEPLENYLELRRDCPELSRFMRTLPQNESLIPKALDDCGWHEGILRNGWNPSTPQGLSCGGFRPPGLGLGVSGLRCRIQGVGSSDLEVSGHKGVGHRV
jgi:hypothetical protein